MQKSTQAVPDELEDSEWLTNAHDVEEGMYIVHLTANAETGRNAHQVMNVADGNATIVLDTGVRATVSLTDIHTSEKWVAIAE
jgi:uncharacterized Rossmann fold enzyme